jgi:ketosteroid isomerase-like protein
MDGKPSADLLREFTATFNTRDLDAVMAYFADDAVFVSPRVAPIPGARGSRARRAVREGLAARFAGLPQLHYGGDDHFASGNRGASEWTLTGTTTDGVRIEVRGCDLWTFRDGLITRKDQFWKIVVPRP